MPWNLDHAKHEVFLRNPLSVVIAQARFHPVLKVPDRIADFQDLVRSRFPVYQQRVSHNVEVGDVAGIRVQQETQFVFSAPNERVTLFLSTTGLGLETRAHVDRQTFQNNFSLAFDALQKVYGTIVPTRVGLRYVNAISLARVAKDLGKEVNWKDLVTEEFLRVPGGPVLDDGTSFSGEVSSGVADAGRLTLRYGLITPSGGAPSEFRLDLDRYSSALIDGSVTKTLDAFASDIFAVFRKSVGPELGKWMNGAKE